MEIGEVFGCNIVGFFGENFKIKFPNPKLRDSYFCLYFDGK